MCLFKVNIWEETFHLHNSHFNFGIMCWRMKSISIMRIELKLRCLPSSVDLLWMSVCDESPFTLCCCIIMCSFFHRHRHTTRLFILFMLMKNLNICVARRQVNRRWCVRLAHRDFSHSWLCVIRFRAIFYRLCSFFFCCCCWLIVLLICNYAPLVLTPARRHSDCSVRNKRAEVSMPTTHKHCWSERRQINYRFLMLTVGGLWCRYKPK